MKFAVVDDLEQEREQIRDLLREFAGERGLEADIDAYGSGEQFLETFCPLAHDIIFLDIYMDGISGIETAAEIRKTDSRSMIIFLTTSREHMGDAFSIHAFDYVEKPVQRDRFFACLNDAMRLLPAAQDAIAFDSQGLGIRVYLRDLLALEADGHNVRVLRGDGRQFVTKGPFSRFSKQLEQKRNFLLVSRGILVNMDYITDFTDRECLLGGGITEPVTVRSRKKLVQAWHDYEFEKLHREAAERRARATSPGGGRHLNTD